jgi:putative ABC transport system permease protein
MRLLDALRLRVRALLHADAVDRELDDEIRQHLNVLIDEHIARGLSPEDARAAARREFGPVTPVIEESREARGVSAIVNLLADLRYGLRLMRRAPGFSSAVVLTVALGIGATTAMFSVVYGIVLRPLPFPEPDRLVNLWSSAPRRGLTRAFVAMANVYDWKARNHVFEDIAALRAVANFNLTGVGEPERLNGSRVSANLFPVLGATPLIGRVFTEEEDEIGRERVAILTYPLWVRRFGADPGIVGRTIALNGEPHTVVGVMRADFAFPTRDYQIYTPLTFDPEELLTRQNYSYLAVARLKHGVTIEQAKAELSVLSAQIEREHPKENEGIGADVAPMLGDTVASVRRPLYILLGAVAAMLLIGLANITNLLLARALVRQRELGVRAALGASRGRLVAQSVAEVVPLLAIGGVIGVIAGAWALQALVPLLPADLPRVENIGLHLPVLAVAAATLAAMAMMVAVWPALEASRRDLVTAAFDGSRGHSAGPRRARLRDALVVAQIAATLWLVIGAALLMRSFVALRQVNPGFASDRVYTLHLAIPRAKYPRDRDVAAFCARLLDRVRTVPEVVTAGLVNRLPLAGGAQTGPIEFEGVDAQFAKMPNVDYRTVTPDYFRTLSIPLLDGRGFTEADDETALPVAIIDERIARTVFAGVSPIGRRMRIPLNNQPWLTIVGVVGHVRHERLEEDTRPQIYFNYHQRAQDRMAMAVKTRIDPSAVAGAIVAAIRAVDADQPVYDARSLDAVIDRSVAQRWLQTTMLAAFAAIALTLASIGVYGVIAYGVGQRTREFGIRLALGARRSEIVALVLRGAARLFVIGAALGLVAAAGTARVVASLLYSVAALDVLSMAMAMAVLLSVALAACAIPARRAAAVDPAVTLRSE